MKEFCSLLVRQILQYKRNLIIVTESLYEMFILIF